MVITPSRRPARTAPDKGHFDGVIEFARSSPGRLIGLGLALMVLCITAAGIAAQQANDHRAALHTLLDDTEPFRYSTDRLYNSLSIADAAAGTGFLFAGQEPTWVRDRYADAVAEAGTQLAEGVDGGDSPDTRRLRSGLATHLPAYTGLVDTARAENRAGHPVGAAYLSEASHLMQETMLPMAQELHSRESAALAAAQGSVDEPPWAALAAAGLALAFLLLTQRLLARRWRRRLNAGLIAATVAAVALGGWIAAAGTVSAVHSRHALDRGIAPLDALSESRILLQQARTDETLQLVRHDASLTYDASFDAAVRRLSTLLRDYPATGPGADQVATARTELEHWLAAHRRMSEAVGAGDFSRAEVVAIGPGDDDAPRPFWATDTALRQGIAAARGELRGNLAQAQDALQLAPAGALLLGSLAVLGIGVGLWPRLREYR